MTDPLTPSAGRNPGPRPALRRERPDSPLVVARPGVGSAAKTAPARGPSDPASAGAPPEPKDKKRSKGGTQATQTKHPKAGKHPKKHKVAKPQKAKHGAAGEHSDHELTIMLPKSVRKALNHSANEHGTTPERLVALVISEWLDH